jgi:translocation and assembly module TamA
VAALDRLDWRFAPGTPEALQDRLRATSALTQAKTEGRTEPADLTAAALTDYRRLTEVLYDAGHYSGVIRIALDGTEAALIPPFATPAQVRVATVTLDPGPAFRFGQVDIAPLAPGSALPAGLATGSPAGAGQLTDGVADAITNWRAASHAKAAVTDEAVTADHAARRLDAQVRLDPGPSVRFGRLIVTPGSDVIEKRIRTIAGLPEGAAFDPTALAKSADRLRRTGTFRSVALTEAAALNPDGTIDITATVVDETPRRYGVGAELSSFEGLTLSGFWLHRNALGRADRFRVGGEVAGLGGQTGGPDYEITVRFDRPAVYGPDTAFFADLSLSDIDDPLFRSRRLDIAIGASRQFSDTLTGELEILYTAARAEYRVIRREFQYLQFPASLTWDRRDDVLNPTKGSYLRTTVTPFAGLAGTESGIRGQIDARAYRRATDRVVLAARAQGGALWGASLDGVLPEFLFSSGGGGTVRGQPYQSLDVAATGGGRSGGRGFAALSLEARVDVTPRIGLVGFADAGYIATDPDFAAGAFHAGAGLGLRYETPLGPLRLDIAGPMAGNTGDGVQIYLGIGQSF